MKRIDMKTDRELLELAAKAAGIGRNALKLWNPLEDDGDAFRLAVKLRMHVDHYKPTSVTVWIFRDDAVRSFDEDQADQAAATRRVIVRAAAAIGESMP